MRKSQKQKKKTGSVMCVCVWGWGSVILQWSEAYCFLLYQFNFGLILSPCLKPNIRPFCQDKMTPFWWACVDVFVNCVFCVWTFEVFEIVKPLRAMTTFSLFLWVFFFCYVILVKCCVVVVGVSDIWHDSDRRGENKKDIG